MKKIAALIAATTFALTSAAFAADTKAPAKLEKPASVAQADWDKMNDTQKKDAVEKAKMAKKDDKTTAAPAKKEKKGGC